MTASSVKKTEPLPLAIRLRYWPVALQLLFMRAVALLPLRLVRMLGALVGSLLWPLAGERRQITLRNLELCFPALTAEQRVQLAKQNFRNTATGFLETAKVWFTDTEKLAKHVEVEGLEHLQHAAAKGKGVLVLGFHLTDLELGGAALAPFCKLAAMYRPHANPVFEQAMQRGRERHFPLIPRDDVRAMLRWLKAGGCVWYAADQDYGAQHSVFAPFFDIPTATIAATSRFARLSGAAVVPFTHVRTAHGIKLFLHPSLDTIPSGNDLADASAANAFLELWLQKHPADYLWLHRRFKTRPDGAESLYPKRKPRYRVDEISGKRFDRLCQYANHLLRNERGEPLLIVSGQQQTFFVLSRPATQAHARKLTERLASAAAQLQRYGVPSVLPVVLRCRVRQRILLRLGESEGRPLLGLAASQTGPVNAAARLLAKLHRHGLQVPNLGWQDFWIKPDGSLALVAMEGLQPLGKALLESNLQRWQASFQAAANAQWQWPTEAWGKWWREYQDELATTADSPGATHSQTKKQ